MFVFHRYPDLWYQEIASNPKFYSLAATYHSRIIGLIVCEIKLKSKLNKEVHVTIRSFFDEHYFIVLTL